MVRAVLRQQHHVVRLHELSAVHGDDQRHRRLVHTKLPLCIPSALCGAAAGETATRFKLSLKVAGRRRPNGEYGCADVISWARLHSPPRCSLALTRRHSASASSTSTTGRTMSSPPYWMPSPRKPAFGCVTIPLIPTTLWKPNYWPASLAMT